MELPPPNEVKKAMDKVERLTRKLVTAAIEEVSDLPMVQAVIIWMEACGRVEKAFHSLLNPQEMIEVSEAIQAYIQMKAEIGDDKPQN